MKKIKILLFCVLARSCCFILHRASPFLSVCYHTLILEGKTHEYKGKTQKRTNWTEQKFEIWHKERTYVRTKWPKKKSRSTEALLPFSHFLYPEFLHLLQNLGIVALKSKPEWKALWPARPTRRISLSNQFFPG